MATRADTRTVLLDTSVLTRIATDAPLAQKAIAYLTVNDYVVVIGFMALIELRRRRSQQWDDIAHFLAPIPYCVAQNPDSILDAEVLAYPGDARLPIEVDGITRELPASDLAVILEGVMHGEIDEWDTALRPHMWQTWQDITKNRDEARPDNGRRYSALERDSFLRESVLTMVRLFHSGFLDAESARGRVIDSTRFKSVYMQALAVWTEYYEQKKQGKSSDIGDFIYLSYIPYVDWSILDNERTDLIRRMNRTGLFARAFEAYTLKAFTANIASDTPLRF